jgi:hypothetical protein
LRPVQNADGSASRWLLTGTAVLAVREEGKLLTDWVERASLEVYQRLTTA